MNVALTGYVPATYVQLLGDYLAQQAPEITGRMREILDAGEDRVAITAWQQALQEAASALNDPELGLKLGKTITAAHFGALGYVLLSCGNLAGAMERLMRYQRLIYDVNPVELRVEADQILLAWGVNQGRPGPLVDECAITALVQFCRDITGIAGLAPLQLCFVNPEPENDQSYEDYFGVEICWAAPETRIGLRPETLQLPLRKPDPALIAVLEQQADAMLAALPAEDDLLALCRKLIADRLREDVPSLQEIAAAQHLSERSLHRRLQEKGWNFRGLLNDTRNELAKDYLRDPRLQLSEIALLLGYSEQSAFSRAFKQHCGESPAGFRRRVAG